MRTWLLTRMNKNLKFRGLFSKCFNYQKFIDQRSNAQANLRLHIIHLLYFRQAKAILKNLIPITKLI